MGMREEVEEVKQAIAAGRATKEQGAAYLEMKAKEINPEAYGTLAQNAAASQAGVPGPVQFQRPSPSQPLTEDQVRARDREIMGEGDAGRGLPSGINPQDRQKMQGYSVPGSPMTTPPQQYIPQGAQPPEVHPGSTMGRPPRGIFEADIPEGYNDPSLMRGSGMPPQMVGGQPRTVDPQLRNEGILSREMANRPKAGPSSIMGGLRSAGKSAGGYMKSLFNDPQRMAMLQGGLSMMDPNTYYDKDNFGSVFTGLNKGLGAATAGHEGVLARRKAVADRKLVDAKIGAEGEDSRKYKSAQIGDGTYLYADADIIQRRNEIMAGGKVGWQEATNMAIKQAGTKIDKGMTPKQTADIQFDYDAGQSKIVEMDAAIALAQDALNTGIVGLGKRGWTAARGFLSLEGDDDNSTKLVNVINSITSQNWKELVGAGGLTAGDKDFLQKVIHNPQSVFTTRASIEKGLRKLRGIQMKAQHSRARELGIPFSKVSGAGTSTGKNLSTGESVDAFIESM